MLLADANESRTREQLLAEIGALKERLAQAGSDAPVLSGASEGWTSPVILSPARPARPRMKVYVVFHQTVEPAYYDELDEDEKDTLTLYGVKGRHATGMKTVYEDELPLYKPILQKKHYQEASALYHVYVNNLAEDADYVGFFHSDMKIGRDAINTAKNIAMASPSSTNIFFMDFFPDAFLGGQTAIIADYPKVPGALKRYNDCFGTSYTDEVLVTTQMIVSNTFIIPVRLYKKLMAWMMAYFIDDIADDFYDRKAKLPFNAGHIIEAFTSMFLALEVAQGAVYHRLPIVHKP